MEDALEPRHQADLDPIRQTEILHVTARLWRVLRIRQFAPHLRCTRGKQCVMTSTTTVTMTSAARSSAAFTAPSTQNTAPVVEFRCLYSYDLRRKAKRWQDGCLRFHTFNKRVMVYDVPRNYIGDCHWREGTDLQDGDDLELDKGVLVQVGEVTGTINQDLTELLDKRKRPSEVQRHELGNGQPSVSYGEPSSIPHVLAQLRPKSLNEVLGTPKGTIGKAALPTKSPYERRNEGNDDPATMARPAKRQRVEARPERSILPTVRPSLRDPARLPKLTGEDARHRVSSRNEDVSSIATAASDMSETIPAPQGPIRKAIISGPDRHIGPIQSIPRTNQTESRVRSPKSGSDNGNVGKEAAKKKSKTAKKSEYLNRQRSPLDSTVSKDNDSENRINEKGRSIVPENVVIHIDSDDKQDGPSVKLQLASRKPRKKIMYRELLPSKTKSSNSRTTPREVSENARASVGSKKDENLSLSNLHWQEQDRLEARLEKHNAKQSRHRSDKPSREYVSNLSSDLFLSQEALHGVNESPDSIDHGQVSGKRHTEGSDRARHSVSAETDETWIPKGVSTVHDTNLALAKMDAILLARSQPPQPPKQPSPKNRIPDSSSDDLASLSVPRKPPDTVGRHSPIQSDPSQPPNSETGSQNPSSTSGLHFECNAPLFQTHSKQPYSGPSIKETTAKSPILQVNSSPGFEKPCLLSPAEHTNSVDVALKPPSSHRPSSQKLEAAQKCDRRRATEPETLAPKPMASNVGSPSFESADATSIEALDLSQPPPQPHVNLLSLKTKPLPEFRAPRMRSPLKKSISDVSSMRPPPPIARPPLPSKMTGPAQFADPWSREAWDLLGCARDGRNCTFDEFIGGEGII